MGIFGVKDYKGPITINIEDGKYLNEIDNRVYEILNGQLNFDGYPVVIELNN